MNPLQDRIRFFKESFSTEIADFIKAVLENKIGNLEQLIVMNSSQKGTHIGRKSLVPAFCGLHNIKFTGSNAYV